MILTAPLRYAFFRRIWFASLLSNMGQFVQVVGASWAMAQLTDTVDMVALVQTAAMLPIMLLALPAGVLADSYDRRAVAIAALVIAWLGAVALTALALLDRLAPWNLMALCLAIGAGMALLAPSWQASVREQVPVGVLPAAIALRSISFNVGRSVGPAVGGLMVAIGGPLAAFAAAAFCYLPLMVMLYLWRPELGGRISAREHVGGSLVAGIAYVWQERAIRALLIRAGLTGAAGSSVAALMPLIARDLLRAGPQTYGFALAAFGIGGVAGAALASAARDRFDGRLITGGGSVLFAAATLVCAMSSTLVLTAPALLFGGAAWMVLVAYFNISIQLLAAPSITGRSIAAFQTIVSGGIALGSWLWGSLGELTGIETALVVSAGGMFLLAFSGTLLPMPKKPGRA